MERISVPKATLGRLPFYLQLLKALNVNEHPNISATSIAKRLSLGEVQVRKDLCSVSGAGKPKIGYVTRDLIRSIERALGYDEPTPAVIVGAGRLGKALYGYDKFKNYGVQIEAAFDSDTDALCSDSTKNILPMDEFENFCRAKNIRIGIITVGEESAQTVCDKMLSCGITAIWNFAPCNLSVPEGVLLQQENLALSLAHLNNQLCYKN